MALFGAPWIFTSDFSRTLIAQAGIAIVACLSYNLLLGEGGMLSFGHAVYAGLGAFAAIHVLDLASAGSVHWPVSLLPLVGGLAGLAVAAALGFLATRRAGIAFAMITLGIGELVASMSLMLPEFFGGEGGITADRVVGTPVLGITFGPQVQVCMLVAAWCLASTAALRAFTRTPLGRLLNAVRDNPERVAFIGYDPQHVRWIAFMVSGFFAGISGGLSAINFELVTAEAVGGARSGALLLYTFLGGTSAFFGPVLGGVLMVLASSVLSSFTQAWPLYLGAAFLVMVMVAPEGLAGLLRSGLALVRSEEGRRACVPLLLLCAWACVALFALSALIEMLYRLQLDTGQGGVVRFGGLELDVHSPVHWMSAAAMLVLSGAACEAARRWAVRVRARDARDSAAEGFHR